MTPSQSWRAGGVLAPGPRGRGWFAALLLALGALVAIRLGLMLAGPLDLSSVSSPPLRDRVLAVATPAEEWLPEPAAGPEAATVEPSAAAAAALPEIARETSEPRVALDPASLTASEIALLHQLAARRAALDRRAGEIDQRAALIASAAADLEQQIARLSALRDEIAAAVDTHDAAEEAKLASLVKIYETMKPRAAAEIFDRLEMPVLIEVVERMREVKSADVLARMNPVKAKQVTSELARRSEMLERTRNAPGRAPAQSNGA